MTRKLCQMLRENDGLLHFLTGASLRPTASDTCTRLRVTRMRHLFSTEAFASY